MIESNNTSNFTFWLGAGASALALPTIAEFKDRLLWYDLNSSKFRDYLDTDDKKIFYEIVKELKWLGNETGNHTSPDTLAQISRLQEDTATYNRIKNILSIFFILEELNQYPFKGRRDPRYTNFLATIMKSELRCLTSA